MKHLLLTRLQILWLFSAFVCALPLTAQVEDLDSTDPKVREKAVESLGDKGQKAQAPPDTVCGALMKTVADPVKEIRQDTIVAAIKTGSSHCQEVLRRATRDADPDVQSLAVDGIVNFYQPGYVKFGWLNSVKEFGSDLKKRFKDPEPLVVPLSVSASDADIDAVAAKIAGGSSMESRANAARAAGILRANRAIPQLLEGAQSADKEVAVESIRALNKIRDVSVGPKMTHLLSSGDQDVQIEAAAALGNLRTKEAVPGLEQLVRSGKKDVKRAALTALAKIPDNGQEKLFLLYLNDKDEDLRAAAAEGIGRGGNADDLKTIQDTFAQEKKETARLSMAFAAVHLGDLDKLPYLVDGLNSTFRRLEARAFLEELAREPKVLSELYTPLASGTRDQKIHLAYVVAMSGTRESESHLERLTRDADSRVAEAAIQALKSLQARLG